VPYDLTPTEVAEILQVSPRTVHRYADNGELRCIRLPGIHGAGHRRFAREDVDEFIARLEQEQTERVAAGRDGAA